MSLYHKKTEDINNTQFKKMQQKWLSKLTISEGRNTYNGVNGILTHYRIRYEPYIGLVRLIIIIITCDCIDCISFIDLPCDPSFVPRYRTRYYSVTTYKYNPILEKHKVWAIVYFIYKGADEEEYESSPKRFFMVL